MGSGHVPVQGTLGHVTFATAFAEVGLGELVLCQLVESENEDLIVKPFLHTSSLGCLKIATNQYML